MSEVVLQALIRLFAILARQGGNITKKQLDYVQEYLGYTLSERESVSYFEQFLKHLKLERLQEKKTQVEISPIDSMEVIGSCYRINETLVYDQKVIVLVKCMELISGGTAFPESNEVLTTCAEIFKIPRSEYSAIIKFATADHYTELTDAAYKVITDDEAVPGSVKISRHLHNSGIGILKVSSANLYFFRLFGEEQVLLNGNPVVPLRLHPLPSGGVLSFLNGAPVYFSSIEDAYRLPSETEQILFEARQIEFQFGDGKIGLHSMSFKANEGQLIAIMGGSGSGKTTLLSVLSGISEPTSGAVLINGININDRRLAGKIGYVSQDDLLIEELTVFENLYFNSRLVFGEMSKEDLIKKVDVTLQQLGLSEARNLKVGSIHDKVLSGGQRKRLNIGLEIIRNPTVFFLDEPISGLSSKDSENVMSLLADLRQRGRLIFIVIHQPSSDIYKLFDKVLIVDKGGYNIYYGHPIEALSQFRKSGKKVKIDATHCLACGNVQAQEIFDIIEEKVLDEYGRETNRRIRSPQEWYLQFQNQLDSIQDSGNQVDSFPEIPKRSEPKPSRFQQLKAYLHRDLRTKLTDRSYLLLIFFEPIFLALILSLLVRRSSGEGYHLLENNNLPAYLFMSIVVVIFIGLTISAEEIFRDRKILFRERFLELSRLAYLSAKVFILALISAMQCYLFMVIGNTILDIEGNGMVFWFTMFTLCCNANLIGLNISASFKSAVTIYILIPLLIIPQMILGGAMFRYEDLHPALDDTGYAPAISSVIPARWAYEALMLTQFRNNPYQDLIFPYDVRISKYRYLNGSYLSTLYELIDDTKGKANEGNCGNTCQTQYMIIRNEMNQASQSFPEILSAFKSISFSGTMESGTAHALKDILEMLSEKYQQAYNQAVSEKTMRIQQLSQQGISIEKLKSAYHNHRVEYLVRKAYSEHDVLVQNNLIRISDPVFIPAEEIQERIKAPYMSLHRSLFGQSVTTNNFNLLVIWAFNVILFIVLYVNGLKRLFRLSAGITIFNHHSREK